MRQTAPTRTATTCTSAAASPSQRSATAFRRLLAASLLLVALFASSAAARAQQIHPSDLGMTFTQQRSKFVGSASTDNFYLRGATVDYSQAMFHGVGPVASFNGLAVTNLRQQIDIHQASFLGGGRYTYSVGHVSPTVWNRRGSVFAEALVGLTLATSGLYPSGETLVSNAHGFTYALGGGVNVNLYHDFELRLMAHDFVTELPNGGTNQQRNIQFSLGVNWHFGN
ncbi:MAG: hypothetical protein HIU91_08285 [Acidobacteria bacterium]|nr:hypothetical protein [Acidobacteriota bacterium]